MHRTEKLLFGAAGVVVLAFAAVQVSQWVANNTIDSLDDKISGDNNHLSNGGFDVNLDSWKLQANWPVIWSGAEGEGSARVVAMSASGSAGRSVFRQCVNVLGNMKFELGGSFKQDGRSTHDGGGRLRVAWYEQQDCVGQSNIDPKSVDPQNVSGWQQIQTGVFTSPPKTQSASVSVIQSVDGRGEFIAHWDNLYFRTIQ